MAEGYKDWSAGDILTAADLEDYTVKQSVMRFADSSARTTALSGVLAEGMVSYLKDTDSVEVYDGSAWAAVGGGKIIAVKHALFTGTQTNSTAAQGNFAVTDLSITHTLADSANKLIISAYLGQAASSQQRANVGLAVADDGTLVGIGDAASNRTRTAAGGGQTSLNASNGNVTSLALTFVYEPGDTASHTYTVRAINPDTTTETIYINRSEIDGDAGERARGSSGFVIQEVSA